MMVITYSKILTRVRIKTMEINKINKIIKVNNSSKIIEVNFNFANKNNK